LFAGVGILSLILICLSGVPFIGLLVILGILIERAGRDQMNFSASPVLILIAWFLSLILLVEGAILNIAVLLAAIIEVVLAILYAVIRKKDKIALATSALIGNTFTALGVWFVFLALQRGFPLYTMVIAGIFTWLVEALIYYLLNRKNASFIEFLVFSLIVNGISFAVGLALP